MANLGIFVCRYFLKSMIIPTPVLQSEKIGVAKRKTMCIRNSKGIITRLRYGVLYIVVFVTAVGT